MSKYHPFQERIVELLCTKTQSTNKHFYRLLCAYYFGKLASMLRTNLHTKERGIVCVNTYVLNLLLSGEGKGHSTNILEENLICGFRQEFMKTVFPQVAEIHLQKLANIRASRDNMEPDLALEKILGEFASLGVLPFSFDAATGPALKQLRQLLLLASAGSMNIEIDEIGSNLLGNTEALTVLFELYDKGLVKPKLIKNTKENVRSEDVEGYTPTNLMMFGTPIKLLDGGKVEDEFMDLLGSGYARRLFFGYSKETSQKKDLSAVEIYDALTDKSLSIEETSIRNYFTSLASISSFNAQIEMSRDVAIDLIQYKIDCERRADKFSSFDEMSKAEMSHRYFKVMKLSGAYAFIDKQRTVSKENLNYAINIAEDSGDNFKQIQQREASHIRLARYLANVGRDVTHVDMLEDLHFYKGTNQQRSDMMTLAIAFGYSNNIVIKRTFVDDIEFFSGESLKETDLSKLTVAHSADITENYQNDVAPFDQLDKLTNLPGRHFVNHHLIDGYRSEVNVTPGFNLAIIDVDGGTQLHSAQSLLEEYTYLAYTTKRSTDRKNRFRLILPLSHTVKLNKADFKQFMSNIFSWLPFDVDTGTTDRCRKWLTNPGTQVKNEGVLLDVTRFIPRTDASVKEQARVISMENMGALERWFTTRTKQGNRSNMLLRYGLALLDSGVPEKEILHKLWELNSRTETPLDNNEIAITIYATICNRAGQKETN